MYLTRFRINSSRPGARRLLSSPQALHAAVMSSFPGLLPSDVNRPRVLWRIDRHVRAETLLHIVSPDAPELTHIVEQAGWPHVTSSASPGWRTMPYVPFLSRLATGDTWSFRLTANPVHTVRRGPGEPTKRTAHVTPRHQLRWLLHRQRHCGFQVLNSKAAQPERIEEKYEVIVHNRRDLSFGKAQPRDGSTPAKAVKLVTATFDGQLTVTDPDALRHTLTRGLGKAKAYGCGLMTLSPPPPQ